jgi:hypothetical protein
LPTPWSGFRIQRHGIAEVPLTPLAVDAFTDQLAIAGPRRSCFQVTERVGTPGGS